MIWLEISRQTSFSQCLCVPKAELLCQVVCTLWHFVTSGRKDGRMDGHYSFTSLNFEKNLKNWKIFTNKYKCQCRCRFWSLHEHAVQCESFWIRSKTSISLHEHNRQVHWAVLHDAIQQSAYHVVSKNYLGGAGGSCYRKYNDYNKWLGSSLFCAAGRHQQNLSRRVQRYCRCWRVSDFYWWHHDSRL